MPQYLRQQSLEDRVAELEQRLELLSRTNQIGSTTLTNGQLVIRRGGAIVVMSAEDPNREVARIGDIGLPDVNGTPQMGIRLRRDTPGNELLFAQQMNPVPGAGFPTQGLAMYDRQGNVIISADTVSGKGVSFPWRPLAFATTGFWAAPRTSATSWQEITGTQAPTDTPRASVNIAFVGDQVAGVNTGGDYRILVAGTTVASGSIPPTNAYVYVATTIDMTPWYAPGTWVRISVQVQRTSGATTGGADGLGGTIRAEVAGAYLQGT